MVLRKYHDVASWSEFYFKILFMLYKSLNSFTYMYLHQLKYIIHYPEYLSSYLAPTYSDWPWFTCVVAIRSAKTTGQARCTH